MSLTKVTYSMINGASANVLDFGAVGDNNVASASANRAAIQAAFTASRDIYFPAGTYYIDAQINIPANTTIHGAGGSVSILKAVPDFVRGTGTYTYSSLLYSEDGVAVNCSIFDMGFDFNKDAYVAPPTAETIIAVLMPTSCDNLLIQNCTFKNVYTGSAVLAGGTGTKILGCSFLDMGFDVGGALNTNPISLNIGARNALVSGCYFNSTTDFFVGVESQAHDILITGNTFVNTYTLAGGAVVGGFSLGPIAGLTVSNNIIDVRTTPGYGIYLGAGGAGSYDGITITGNTIYTGANAAINISPVSPLTTGSYENIVVKGNTIYGNLTDGIATESAIQIGNTLDGAAPISQVYISDNTIIGYNGPGVYVNNPSKVVIKNNIFNNCAIINAEKCPIKLVTTNYTVFTNVAVTDNIAYDSTGWTTNLAWVDSAVPATVTQFVVKGNVLTSSGATVILANETTWYQIYTSNNLIADNSVNGFIKTYTADVLYSAAGNKGVKLVSCTGDGGTNTVVSYFVSAFGAANAAGCIGAWSATGIFASPGDSISSSNTYQIFGWISAA
jgi:hypothetical protein